MVALGGLDHFVSFFAGGAKRLFADRVLARVQGADDVLAMQKIGRRHDNRFDIGVSEQSFIIVVGARAHFGFGVFAAFGVEVHGGDDFVFGEFVESFRVDIPAGTPQASHTDFDGIHRMRE